MNIERVTITSVYLISFQHSYQCTKLRLSISGFYTDGYKQFQ